MNHHDVTPADSPNAIKILEHCRQLVAQALEVQADSRSKLVQCMRLIEQVQHELRIGIECVAAPIRERIEKLEANVLELQTDVADLKTRVA